VTAPSMLNVEQAAETLGVSRRHAYDLIARDEFPVIVRRIGHRYKIPARALERYLDGEDGPGVTEPAIAQSRELAP
jgi:excisionase family DNA binding protein